MEAKNYTHALQVVASCFGKEWSELLNPLKMSNSEKAQKL